MRLNSVDIKNINVRFDYLGWIFRIINEEVFVYGKIKLEIEYF